MTMLQTVLVWFAVYVWFQRLVMGAGAMYAAVRMWGLRQQPLSWRLGIYMLGFSLEAIVSAVLIFLAKGVHLTWKFAAVMILGGWLSDSVRIPLIFYLIKGPGDKGLLGDESSGAKDPEFWKQEFRQAVRDVFKEEGLSK
jgi:hypothetical protein